MRINLRRLPVVLALIPIAAAIGAIGIASARSSTTTLPTGDQLDVVCANGGVLQARRINTSTVRLNCGAVATVTPTRTPTRTPLPATATPAPPTPTGTPHQHGVGACGESMAVWHPPVINGCAAGHEHGDAPPSWIAAAGYSPSFHGHFNTSAAENTAKHSAMKGFSARFSNVDVYFRIHAASNPLDRMARYHSYEIWARDASGGVSHWQGWYNSGDPVAARVLRRNPPLPGESQRPIILVVDEAAAAAGIGCEQWYSAPGEPIWGWDFGWTICGSTTYYRANENATASNQAAWPLTGDLGGTRRLEASWYGFRAHPTGTFWATQFGEIVNGPTDARCTATTVKFGVTYANVCLSQYIAPTMTQVSFPNNALQKDFSTSGVHVPN